MNRELLTAEYLLSNGYKETKDCPRRYFRKESDRIVMLPMSNTFIRVLGRICTIPVLQQLIYTDQI